MDRSKKIIKTSILGIIANIVLVAFKALVGFIANSVSVIMDAVNNLSDAFSSIITIVGTKLSNKPANKKHPYGYGRIEYLTSAIIAAIVLVAGVLSIIESIKKIITPEDSNFSLVFLIIISAGILVKLFIGLYFRKVGKGVNSGALVSSGTDALSDSMLSIGTLVSALLSFLFEINIEGYVGAVISVFIIKTGIEMFLDSVKSIIGTRTEQELTVKLRELISSYDGVNGCYDIILHNYGPSKIIGSAHIEVSENMTAKEIYKLTRIIIVKVYEELGIILTIGIYATNESEEFIRIRKSLDEIIAKYPEILQIHGFFAFEDKRIINFDLIVDFNANGEEIKNKVVEEISEKYKEWTFVAILDSDFSD